ncbi:MAG: transcription-repair coupling factor [Bacilli bacterium]
MSFFNTLFSNNINEQHISGLTNELKCLYMLNNFNCNDKSILLVTSSLYEATNFYQMLSCYTNNVILFPMDDFLTSEALAISPELKNTRLETLNSLINENKKIVITNLMGYLRFLPTIARYKETIIKLKIGEEIMISSLIVKLYNLGYIRESTVSSTGEIAVRGFIVDVFLIGYFKPVRIEFFGDTIESIRIFDENTQRTIENLDSIIIYPNNEKLVKTKEEVKYYEMPNYIEVSNICNYLGKYNIFFDDYDRIKSSYELLVDEMLNYTILSGEYNIKYMFEINEIQNDNEFYFTNFDNSLISVNNTKNYESFENAPFPTDFNEINKILNGFLEKKKIVIICVSTLYQANKIIEYTNNKNIVITNERELFIDKINIIIKNIINGFQFENYVVISENEIFGKKKYNSQYKNSFKFGVKIRDINKLNVGDYIVHSDHGIGRYIGLKSLLKNGIKKDYVVIEYLESDKLYIPVEKIELISKYSSSDSVVPKINKLGSTEWEKTKLRVRKKLEDIAGQLLELYATRENTKGFAFAPDDENQINFEEQFEFEETIDQLKVIEEIKKDMEMTTPMDRLLCGDVGFGKTEVAFRAMFKAVISGKQVALLCPTTILSNQHYTNIIERFRNFPIKISILNRFNSPKETEIIKNKLKDGTIDIVIGTHSLFNNKIIYKDLGLLVIDEEQRFGVKHKEQIKKYKNSIDVLTLSATPIPRTLQMSMLGIRSLSLIETPPFNRFPIQTYVLEENNAIIKDAIYKELSRDGQVFILFNHVIDMENKRIELSKLVPDAKIICAHGRMNKKELEDVMIKFISREYNVLLCTTIIETGIDIPNVNTLLIMDADRFGLSQLYQIRGRVGRSNKIAYCYLMYDKKKILSELATKRLNSIKEFTELGSGYAIAMRDLAIRGAGDILGREQAGFIDSVGIEVYLRMLEEEINKIKGNKFRSDVAEKDEQPLIDVETTISDDYVNEVDLKIEIHKMINSIDSLDKLDSIKMELEDRFGILSDSIIIYMYEELFEKQAKSLNITKLLQTKNNIIITLPENLTNNIDGQSLFVDANKLTKKIRFSMKTNLLVITLDIVNLDKHFIYYLIDIVNIIKKCIKEK